MELEFDKEIDAILRRARETRGVLVGDDPPKKHLDADSITAFAENALPEKVKMLYTGHLADCDRCRKQLSHVILMNTEAASSVDGAASSVSAPATVTWYQNLFKTSGLAVAMGALVLVFSTVLGYLVLQRSNKSANSTVTQVTNAEPKIGVPSFGGDVETANSISPAPIANVANSAAASSNREPGTVGSAAANTASNIAAKDAPAGGTITANRDKNFSLDGVAAEPLAAAPPPPVAKAMDDRGEKKAESEKGKETQDSALSARRADEFDRRRDAPPAAAKTGPARSGPLQNKSNQINENMSEMAVSRVVGGKTFNNRNGAWYDSAYRGQATTNYRRGTDDYKKLDRGLRNIADTLGGTVVVVWKEKAYRIQ